MFDKDVSHFAFRSAYSLRTANVVSALHFEECSIPSAMRWADILRSFRAYFRKCYLLGVVCWANILRVCSAYITFRTIIIWCWYTPQKCLAGTYSVHYTIILWHLYALQCASCSTYSSFMSGENMGRWKSRLHAFNDWKESAGGA